MLTNFNTYLEKTLTGDLQAAERLRILICEHKLTIENIENAKHSVQLALEQQASNTYAKWLFAVMHYYGVGFEKDEDLAFTLFQQCIEQKNPLALVDKATFYFTLVENELYYLDGDNKDPITITFIKELYEKAYEVAGLASAANGLGNIYAAKEMIGNHRNPFQDFAKAKYFYEIALKAEYPSAAYNLAILYEKGRVGKINDLPDYEKVRGYYEEYIRLNGGIDGYRYLGVMYENGLIGKENEIPNFEKAKYYYELASSHGDGIAARALATLYSQGKVGSTNGTPDYGKAISYYELAAKLGCIANTYYPIANLYIDGLIEKKESGPNYDKAQMYLQLAIDANASDAGKAANLLGYLYDTGKLGVEGGQHNYDRAKKYYELAIKLDHNANAHYNIGRLYINGYLSEDASANLTAARKHYELAYQAKCYDAAQMLGLIYYYGGDYPRAETYAKAAWEGKIETAGALLGKIYYYRYVVLEANNTPPLKEIVDIYLRGVIGCVNTIKNYDTFIEDCTKLSTLLNALKSREPDQFANQHSQWITFLKGLPQLRKIEANGNSLLQEVMLNRGASGKAFACDLIAAGIGIDHINEQQQSALEIAIVKSNRDVLIALLAAGALHNDESWLVQFAGRLMLLPPSKTMRFLGELAKTKQITNFRTIMLLLKEKNYRIDHPLLCHNYLIRFNLCAEFKWFFSEFRLPADLAHKEVSLLQRTIKKIDNNDFQLVEFLLARHARILTPEIKAAIKTKNSDLVSLLLTKVRLRHLNQGELLHQAIASYSPELLQILLAHGFDPQATVVIKGVQHSPLHRIVTLPFETLTAANQQTIEPMMTLLVKYGANPYEIDERPYSLLRLAVDRDNYDAVRFLIKNSKFSQNPDFHLSLAHANNESLALLLANGANMRKSNEFLYVKLGEFVLTNPSRKEKEAIYPYFIQHAVKMAYWEELILFLKSGAAIAGVNLDLLTDEECHLFGNFIHKQIQKAKSYPDCTQHDFYVLEKRIERRLMFNQYPGLYPTLQRFQNENTKALIKKAIAYNHPIADILEHLRHRYREETKVTVNKHHSKQISHTPLFLSTDTANLLAELSNGAEKLREEATRVKPTFRKKAKRIFSPLKISLVDPLMRNLEDSLQQGFADHLKIQHSKDLEDPNFTNRLLKHGLLDDMKTLKGEEKLANIKHAQAWSLLFKKKTSAIARYDLQVTKYSR